MTASPKPAEDEAPPRERPHKAKQLYSELSTTIVARIAERQRLEM